VVRGIDIMKKIGIILLVVLFVAPLMAQTRPPEDGSVEEWNKYYQEREAMAEEKVEEYQNEIEELNQKIDNIETKTENIRQWKPEEKQVMENFKEVPKNYVVKKGDWLSKLAEYEEVYGKGNYAKWPVIYRANRDQIKDPDLIYPGQNFDVPRLLPEEWKVYKGETLKGISSYYEIYDSAKEWEKIYKANNDKISNPDVIDSGMVLDIPRP